MIRNKRLLPGAFPLLSGCDGTSTLGWNDFNNLLIQKDRTPWRKQWTACVHFPDSSLKFHVPYMLNFS
jgi:hypothetical protein